MLAIAIYIAVSTTLIQLLWNKPFWQDEEVVVEEEEDKIFPLAGFESYWRLRRMTGVHL